MADRARLDAVLFDAGGTLGRLDFEWMAEAVTELGMPLDAPSLRAAELTGRRWYDESVGYTRVSRSTGESSPPLGAIGDTQAYFRGTLVSAGVPDDLVPRALDRWLARQRGPGLWTRVMEGAAEALDGVGALGLRRAVVSNSDGRAEQHVRDWGLLGKLEFVVDSHHVGIEKPDPRIFRIALDRMGLPAERVLYVGDIRCADEAGSRAAGLHFVLIDPSGTYADPGTESITGIARLPDWIARHFVSPATAQGPDDTGPAHAHYGGGVST